MTTIEGRLSSLEESRDAMITGINALAAGQQVQTGLLDGISKALLSHTGLLEGISSTLNENSKVLSEHTRLLQVIVDALNEQSAELSLIKGYMG